MLHTVNIYSRVYKIHIRYNITDVDTHSQREEKKIVSTLLQYS